jgi:hypothetical protein
MFMFFVPFLTIILFFAFFKQKLVLSFKRSTRNGFGDDFLQFCMRGRAGNIVQGNAGGQSSALHHKQTLLRLAEKNNKK